MVDIWVEDKIDAGISNVLKKLGYFPTAKELRCENGRLLSAIYRHGKNLSYFRVKFGQNTSKKSHRYWHSWDNVEAEIKRRFSNLIKVGLCPNTAMMKAVGFDSVVFRKKMYGGIEGISKKMNCIPISGYVSSDGHLLLSTYELIFDEYLYSLDLEHQPNGYIVDGKKYKYDQKVGNIYFEILGYDGDSKRAFDYRKRWVSKESFYNKLNCKLVAIERCVFRKSSKEIENELDRIFTTLGLNTTKKRIFDIEHILSNCSGITEQSVIDSLKLFENKIGKFPSANDLIKYKRYDILNSVRKFGGFKQIKRKLGLANYRKPDNFYTLDVTLTELLAVAKVTGRFPLCEECSSSLRHAVAKHGGFRKLRAILK